GVAQCTRLHARADERCDDDRARRLKYLRGRGDPQTTVEHDAQHLTPFQIDRAIANVEPRIVGQHRTDPGQYGARRSAQALYVLTRRIARNPAALAIR